jgi:cell division septation protein DedD
MVGGDDGDSVGAVVGTAVGVCVGATVLTMTLWTTAVDPSTLDSNSAFKVDIKPASISEIFLPAETVIFVTTVTEAAGLPVMETDCIDMLETLGTEESAFTNAVVSIDVVMMDKATFTSVVLKTAVTMTTPETSRRSEAEPFGRFITMALSAAEPLETVTSTDVAKTEAFAMFISTAVSEAEAIGTFMSTAIPAPDPFGLDTPVTVPEAESFEIATPATA